MLFVSHPLHSFRRHLGPPEQKLSSICSRRRKCFPVSQPPQIAERNSETRERTSTQPCVCQPQTLYVSARTLLNRPCMKLDAQLRGLKCLVTNAGRSSRSPLVFLYSSTWTSDVVDRMRMGYVDLLLRLLSLLVQSVLRQPSTHLPPPRVLFDPEEDHLDPHDMKEML